MTAKPEPTPEPEPTQAPEPTATPAPAPDEPFDVSIATLVGRPAETNSLNGVTTSPVDGNVYVASVGGSEITVHDPETGEILDRIGQERGVNGPDDVFITQDGTIYWTDLIAGNVGRLTPDGEFTTQQVGPGVNPITMSEDGRLFVGRVFLGTGLYELDPMLEAEPIALDPALQVNSFQFGPDGLLYAPSIFTGQLLRIDVDTQPLAPEVIADGLGVPVAAKFNAADEIHVANLAQGEVFKVDLDGGDHEVVLDVEGTIDNIAFDAQDRLFVIAGVDNQVIRVDDQGATELSEPGLGQPAGVAVTADGTVWVADFFAMHAFSQSDLGTPSLSLYDRFVPPGTGFSGAATVAVDGDNLITTNTFSGAVQVLEQSTGDVVLDLRDAQLPLNAIRHDGRIVVVQPLNGNVVDAENVEDVVVEGLVIPLGLASDGTTLYVGDWATGTIWAVDDAGTTVLAEGLAQPEGLAIDGDRLLVVETGAQQLTAIDLLTGESSPVITGLDYSAPAAEGGLPMGQPAGVTVGPDGAIYVTDDGVNAVYRFER